MIRPGAKRTFQGTLIHFKIMKESDYVQKNYAKKNYTSKVYYVQQIKKICIFS